MARLIVFYGVLAALVAGVAAVVINHGRNETPMPAIAGWLRRDVAQPLRRPLWPPPYPRRSAALHRPGVVAAGRPVLQPAAVGPVRQRHQQREHPRRPAADAPPRRRQRHFHLTGDVNCIAGGSQKLDARNPAGPQGRDHRHSGRASRSRRELQARPNPIRARRNPRNAAAHRRSLRADAALDCFCGARSRSTANGPSYKVSAKTLPLGTVTYNKLTGWVGRRPRLRARRTRPHDRDGQRTCRLQAMTVHPDRRGDGPARHDSGCQGGS